MITLNIAYPEASDIKFEVSHFPDGQQDLRLLNKPGDFIKQRGATTSWSKGELVFIKSRFNSFKDLELILAATVALRRLGVEEVSLFIPYLLGARSDREFKEGGTSYLVEVVAPILNAQNYKAIVVLDAHSDVAAACIHHLKIVDNQELVKFALHDLYGPDAKDNFVLVSPDGGSLKKIYKVADGMGFKGDVVICSKFRDWEGKLSRVEVPIALHKHGTKDMIIIDDICDGGRTFLEIAKRIKEYKYGNKVYLIVTHGIFSAGFGELILCIDGIYTTNSYSDLDLSHVPKNFQPFVKQLNVFQN